MKTETVQPDDNDNTISLISISGKVFVLIHLRGHQFLFTPTDTQTLATAFAKYAALGLGLTPTEVNQLAASGARIASDGNN